MYGNEYNSSSTNLWTLALRKQITALIIVFEVKCKGLYVELQDRNRPHFKSDSFFFFLVESFSWWCWRCLGYFSSRLQTKHWLGWSCIFPPRSSTFSWKPHVVPFIFFTLKWLSAKLASCKEMSYKIINDVNSSKHSATERKEVIIEMESSCSCQKI